MKKIIMKIFILSVALSIIMLGCNYLNKKLGLKDDNVIEETIEKQIEAHTGLDIDLTPSTAEKK
ncbi:MAG: hypothetical protein R3230_01325 [Nitrosopumilaceae archaeon]|nr:hypothetical protein [Nitrosopumilaceae archaeon]